MSNADRNRQLDRLTEQFLTSLESGDIETVERIWAEAGADPELEQSLLEAVDELVRIEGPEGQSNLAACVTTVLQKAAPSWEVLQPAAGPVTVADVAQHLRRLGLPGLNASDLALNDRLMSCTTPVPDQLGLTAIVAWGKSLGDAPETYWKVFREAALAIRLRRESATTFQLAARPRPRRPTGGQAE